MRASILASQNRNASNSAKALRHTADYGKRKAVKILRIIATLTVLAAWLPATSHCVWTGAGLLPGDCQTEHHHGDAPAHSHDDCGQCVLESGSFKLAGKDAAHLAFIPVLQWQLQFPAPPPDANVAFAVNSGRAPPDRTTHHFRTRAALPGRAPALL